MIGRARSNHRAEIEDQFFILSQMAEEIRLHFEKGVDEIEHIAKENAICQAEGDDLIYSSVMNSYSYDIERRWSMSTQSRQIIFCAIYAYYEAMLNRIISYHGISVTIINDLRDAKSMFKRICTNLLQRSGGRLCLSDDEFTNDYCRLLRNHFMHGVLIKEARREELKSLSSKYGGVIYNKDNYAEINEHSFILKVLNSVYNNVINIDDAFSSLCINQIKREKEEEER